MKENKNEESIDYRLHDFFLPGISQASTNKIQLTQTLGAETQAYGILENLANALSGKMDMEIELIHRPAKREFQDLMEDRKYHGTFIRMEGFEKQIPHLIKISPPIMQSPFFAFALSDDIKIDGWESLTKYKVAYRRGTKFIENNIKIKTDSIILVDSAESALKLIVVGRADVYVESPLIALKLTKSDEFKDKGIIMLKPAVNASNFHVYFDDKYPVLAEKFTKVLEELTSEGTYQDIVTRNK